MSLVYELSNTNLGSKACYFACRLKSIFLRHSKNHVFSCTGLGTTHGVSEVHGTDRRPSAGYLRPDTGGLECADRRICLRQAYGHFRPPPKSVRSLQQRKNTWFWATCLDKPRVAGLILELETINWDVHLAARCSPLAAPQFLVASSALSSC